LEKGSSRVSSREDAGTLDPDGILGITMQTSHEHERNKSIGKASDESYNIT